MLNRDKWKNHKLKITTLSPIHIGTGEVYEPTNFVIDEKTLYEFNEILFYKSLNQFDKKSFDSKLGNWLQIIDFYKRHTKEAKSIAYFEAPVTKKVFDTYEKINNKDGSKNTNQLQIQRTFKNPNIHTPIIPGSSFKGMLDTIFQIYPRSGQGNDVRQNLVVSDCVMLEGGVEIGYCYRKHKNPDRTAKSKIPQIIEVIKENSIFITDIKTEFEFSKIKYYMKSYYEDRSETIYRNINNGFIARIGKFVGKAYMIDDGKNVYNSYGNEVATHTLYEDNQPFGWIKVELISEEEYQNNLDLILLNEKNYLDNLMNKQQEIKEKIKLQKQLIQEELKRKEEEQKRLEEEKLKQLQAEQEKLSKMNPIDKILYDYNDDIPKIINDMKAGNIENFENIKKDLALKIKEKLKKEPKQWDKAKQKALKRKEYIESLLK